MADIGGFAGGIQSAVETLSGLQQYQQSKQLFPYQLQDAMLTPQMKQVQLQSAQMQLKNQQQEMMMLGQLAATGKLGPGQSPAEQLSAMAQVKIAGGDVNGAREMLSTASTITANQSLNAEREFKIQSETWGTIGSLLQNVHDDRSFAIAKIQFSNEHPEMMKDPRVQKFMEAPYSPENVQKAIDGAQTILQAAQTKAAEGRSQVDGVLVALDKAKTEESKVTTQLKQTQIENLKKAGGKNLVPKASDFNYIMDLVKQDLGNPDVDEQLTSDIRARSVRAVERMKQLQSTGVPLSAASRQAFAEAKAAGDFGGLPQRGKLGRPNSLDRPLALPKTAADVQDNQWYLIDGQSKLYIADKKAFFSPAELEEIREKEEEDDGEGAE